MAISKPPMKILVTGGTGFLGRHVVWRLAAAGWQVVFVGRNSAAAEEVIAHAPGTVEWLPLEHGAPTAGDDLIRAAEGASAIIHCAALSSPWGSKEDFWRANVASTEEVLTACRQANIPRLVHISTPSLYFNYRNCLDIQECSPLPPPVNEYALTKRKAEEQVRQHAPPETIILRPRALFGPWDQTLMPRLLRVIRRGPIPLMNNGQALLDLTYIDNAVEAVYLATVSPVKHPFAIYNVSNGEPVVLVELLKMMAEEFDLPLRTRKLPWPLVATLASAMELYANSISRREPMLTRYGAGVLAFSQTLNLDAIRRDLGYDPKISVREGIRRHAAWWRQSNPT